MNNKNTLEVKNLKKYFPINRGIFQKNISQIKAVDDVTFEIVRGEIFSFIGESGCGKSTLCRTILRLLEKTDGTIKFNGIDIYDISRKELRKLRVKMQIIFQDPFTSLNPRKIVRDLIGEPLIAHKIVKNKNEYHARVEEIMEMCGLAKYHMQRYPHEFSGGQRQRIAIARSLILNPEFIVADEPVSALDVSIQSQIINLLQEFQQKYNLSYMFISHDLNVVRYISHRVGVLYLGSLVEIAKKDDLYNQPLHPYTKALMSCILSSEFKQKNNQIFLNEDISNELNLTSGCKFSSRCPYVMDICKVEIPILKNIENEHKVACHLY